MKFSLSGFDTLSDLSGYSDGTAIGLPGSQWFIVPGLVSYFYEKNIKIYVETLPSVYTRRRANGIPLAIGTLNITAIPEIAILPEPFIKDLKYADHFPFLQDTPVLAFTEKKFADICSIKNIRASIPNPRTSYLGIIFKRYYEKNCGYFGELKSTAILSSIPHREIPAKLMSRDIQCGIMWKSEAKYMKFKFVPVVDKPEKFSIALLKNASSSAKFIFEEYRSGILDQYYNKFLDLIPKQ
ncbi:MAG: hypothetical protein QXZ44_01230 [Ferroplasma sp.]